MTLKMLAMALLLSEGLFGGLVSKLCNGESGGGKNAGKSDRMRVGSTVSHGNAEKKSIFSDPQVMNADIIFGSMVQHERLSTYRSSSAGTELGHILCIHSSISSKSYIVVDSTYPKARQPEQLGADTDAYAG